MPHPLSPSWKVLIDSLDSQISAPQIQLEAVYKFRKDLDSHLIKYLQDNPEKNFGAEDLAKLIESLYAEYSLKNPQQVADRLGGLNITLNVLNKKKFGQPGWAIAQNTLCPISSLLTRISAITLKSLPEKYPPVQKSSESEQQAVIQFVNQVFKDTLSDGQNEIERLTSVLKTALHNPDDSQKYKQSMQQFLKFWADENIAGLALEIFGIKPELCKDTYKIYHNFLLLLLNKKNCIEKSDELYAPFLLEFTRFHSQQLIQSKLGFFQNKENIGLLQKCSEQVRKAESISAIKDTLNEIQQKYQPRQGVFYLVNLTRKFLGIFIVADTVDKTQELSTITNHLTSTAHQLSNDFPKPFS